MTQGPETTIVPQGQMVGVGVAEHTPLPGRVADIHEIADVPLNDGRVAMLDVMTVSDVPDVTRRDPNGEDETLVAISHSVTTREIPAFVSETAPSTERSFFGRQIDKLTRKAAPVTALFLGASVVAAAAGAEVAGASVGERAHKASTPIEGCKTGEFKHPASGPDYVKNAFLPKGGKLDFSKNKDMVQYLNDLFEKDPVGNKMEMASVAALMALVGNPSHDGAVADPNYNYLANFTDKVATYIQPNGGLKAARQDCKALVRTFNEVANYNPNWAQKGENVVMARPIRDKNNPDPVRKRDIIGMELVQVPADGRLKGIELRLPKNSENLDGFPPVLIDHKGRMFLKGITLTGAVPVPQLTQGGGTFGETNGNGESNQAGNINESGGDEGSTPGNPPSFGGGGGGEGGPTPTTRPTTPSTTPPTTLPPKDTPGTLPPAPEGNY